MKYDTCHVPFGRVEAHTYANLTFRITHPIPGDPIYILDAVLKVDNGVRYVSESRRERPSTDWIAHRCLRLGEFSPRPFVPGMRPDFSCLDCVLALFYDFCRRCGVNANELMRHAYPGAEESTTRDEVAWRRVLDAAEWQGTTFPGVWSSAAVLGLLISLRDSRPRLAAVMLDSLNLPHVPKRCGSAS